MIIERYSISNNIHSFDTSSYILFQKGNESTGTIIFQVTHLIPNAWVNYSNTSGVRIQNSAGWIKSVSARAQLAYIYIRLIDPRRNSGEGERSRESWFNYAGLCKLGQDDAPPFDDVPGRRRSSRGRRLYPSDRIRSVVVASAHERERLEVEPGYDRS